MKQSIPISITAVYEVEPGTSYQTSTVNDDQLNDNELLFSVTSNIPNSNLVTSIDIVVQEGVTHLKQKPDTLSSFTLREYVEDQLGPDYNVGTLSEVVYGKGGIQITSYNIVLPPGSFPDL